MYTKEKGESMGDRGSEDVVNEVVINDLLKYNLLELVYDDIIFLV